MALTLDQYLKNPQGKGSAASNVVEWKREYDPRYRSLLEKHGDFETTVHRSMTGNRYFIHVKIPSETHDSVVYDVVLKVEKKGTVSSGTVIDWPLRAISNSPSFVYTYENVFRRNKLLVEELKNQLPTESYRDKPNIRNPHSIVGYEKSVYYAVKYVMDKFKTIDKLDKASIRMSMTRLKTEFIEFDKVMNKINREQAKKVEANRKEREARKQKKQRNVYRNTNLQPREQENDRRPTIVNKVANRVKPLNTQSNRRKTIRKI